MGYRARSYKTEGFILKKKNYGEADRIITIFTKYHGKLVVLAKGIRKITSRKSPHMEVFNKVSLYIVSGKTFSIVTEAQTVETYPCLKTNLPVVAHAYHLVELVDKLCAEKEVYPSVFYLLERSFKDLDKNPELAQAISEQFSLSFLREMGYLAPGKIMTGDELENYLRGVLERNLSSSSLLTRVS
ncbi:DNA repair protein RecO [Candidatus Gottesmanbacteria bacterium RIFCSPHIGHO2_02_FULL_39_11]|uniref:DNA repair protein RecO n=1 Tax=Candidatus Gottesmanbacteria bacterium RIFCSPHIGHO2_02_FULL_39_11 TaxID=1798382 RepID=A0A1F5ZV16_9BACT|nr:MAG: DNA repair protein RecO [Candidatus Gottesmanbacteria bacterium RIFCSPHIGHO2_02_FULL_39_11]